jgi:hypothetical protein
MTEKEIEKVAEHIAAKLATHPPQCVTFDAETIEDMKAFFKRLRSCKAVAWSTFISAVTYAVIAALVAGIGYKLIELAKK